MRLCHAWRAVGRGGELQALPGESVLNALEAVGDGVGEGVELVENGAGDFIFIEPGVPHEVFNDSDTEPVVAVVARSDATEWENIIPYDRHSEP